jgi:hypothetical protein
MKKITLILAAVVLSLGFASTASAVCDTTPTLEVITDGTIEGTYAMIYWDDCDGESWQVCTKGGPPQLNPAKLDGFQPYPCETVTDNFYQIPYGGPTHILIRWMDGNQAGTRHLIDFDWVDPTRN